jgi:hypothetical protein
MVRRRIFKQAKRGRLAARSMLCGYARVRNPSAGIENPPAFLRELPSSFENNVRNVRLHGSYGLKSG